LIPVGIDTQILAEDSVDWKLGLNYSVNDSNFIYGVFSRGHTTGSHNIFPPWDPYREMEVLNFDAGWKAEFNDGRLLTQVSVYHENIEGFHAAFADQDIPSSAGQVQNASSDSTIYGIEVTAQGRFENASVDFSFSFNETELGDFNNITHPLTGETVDLTGGKFPFAPERTVNLGAEYNFQLGGDTTLTPRFDLSYRSDTYADLFDAPEFLLESQTLLNLRLRFERKNWYATLWMTNATDERYVGAIQNLGALYYAAPPRQSGLLGGMNF
jgi:outer membrane receptor protein involved in Fe transport